VYVLYQHINSEKCTGNWISKISVCWVLIQRSSYHVLCNTISNQ